ncbi:MAG: hypothetical protein GX196_07665 [Clostridiaceae bacterium]|nr:hypothetical protein [Clostridiaceae bacterium]
MKKRIISLILILIFAMPKYISAQISPWARDEIKNALSSQLVREEIMLLDFQENITRKDFCIIITSAYEKILNTQINCDENYFLDTKDPYVNKAYKLNLVKGIGEGLFNPDGLITRQEIATILSRFLSQFEHPSIATKDVLKRFSDKAQISDWAALGIAQMVDGGYMLGVSENEFSPLSYTTVEQAVAIVYRIYEKYQKEKPHYIQIITPSEGDMVDKTLSISFEVSGGKKQNEYYVYLVAGNEQKKFKTQKQNLNIELLKEGTYTVFIGCDNYFSLPVTFTVSSGDNVPGVVKKQYYKAKEVNISWDGEEGKEYKVEISQIRATDSLIPPKEPECVTVLGTSYSFYTKPNRIYTIRVYDAFDNIIKEIQVNTKVLKNYNEIFSEFFSDHVIECEEDAQKYLETITVNVWQLNQKGEKVSAKMEVVVHQKIAQTVKLIFDEIYNGEEQFPIKSIIGYSWRQSNKSRLSQHNYGLAIDINPDENYCIYQDGTQIGKYWKPYEDPYSITPYGDVVEAFEKYGFTWGGDAWSNPKDYMHFSFMGT